MKIADFFPHRIKVIIWDIDGTLWRSEKLGTVIREEFVNYLCEVSKKSKQETRKLFSREEERWPCWSSLVAAVSGRDEREIILDVERRVDKSCYLNKDNKLIATFETIRDFRHVVLTNGTLQSALLTLRSLGFFRESATKYSLDISPFEKIFTPDQTGTIKPRKDAFLKVLEYTKLSPQNHLLIGDTPEIDLIPAKALGMKTCLVWGNHAQVDISLPTIYEVPLIFSLKWRGKYFLGKIWKRLKIRTRLLGFFKRN